MSSQRLFFALLPDESVRTALVAQAAPFLEQLQAQAVPAENLHATLCFVGAVEEEKIDQLQSVAAGLTGPRAALKFDALEWWETPKILCATAAVDHAALAAVELARRIGAALVSASFTPDIKPFRPHLTLGRKVRAEAAKTLPWPQDLRESLSIRATEFVLMSSQRVGGRSIYSVVNSWPLVARETQYSGEK